MGNDVTSDGWRTIAVFCDEVEKYVYIEVPTTKGIKYCPYCGEKLRPREIPEPHVTHDDDRT